MDRTKASPSMFTPGSVAMVGLRLAEPFLQFSLLRDGYAANFMQSVLRMPQSYALAPAVLAVPGISSFSIGGLNEVASAVVAMYGVAGLRHVSPSRYPRLRCHSAGVEIWEICNSIDLHTDISFDISHRHTGLSSPANSTCLFQGASSSAFTMVS